MLLYDVDSGQGKQCAHKFKLPAVPVRLIAGFKKMKSLTKDLKVIVAALETSPELEISGHRVRRKLPLPFVNETEVLLRTVIVENLPPQPTIGASPLVCVCAFALHCWYFNLSIACCGAMQHCIGAQLMWFPTQCLPLSPEHRCLGIISLNQWCQHV